MSTMGPGTGVRSLVAAQRQRATLLVLEGYPEISATPDVVARLSAAKEYFAISQAETITLNLGGGPLAYGASDIETLLGLSAEAFARYDAGAS